MKKLWSRYAERIDALSLRERLILFGAVTLLLAVFVYSLWIDAEFAKAKRLSGELAQRQAAMKAIQEQVTKLGRAREADPDRANRERLAALRAQLSKLNSTIAAEQRKFTAPDRMRAVLEGLLARNNRVHLVALKTLPVSSISEERAAAAGQSGAGTAPATSAGRLIFRHGVELTVSGAYLDVLGYLSELERLPTQLYWNALGLEGDYPTVTVKMTVYTLSLDRAWLSV